MRNTTTTHTPRRAALSRASACGAVRTHPSQHTTASRELSAAASPARATTADSHLTACRTFARCGAEHRGALSGNGGGVVRRRRVVRALQLVHATGVVHCGVSLNHVLLGRADDLASVMLSAFRRAMALGPHARAVGHPRRLSSPLVAPEIVSPAQVTAPPPMRPVNVQAGAPEIGWRRV